MARDYSSRHDRDNRDKNGRLKPARRPAPAAKNVRPKKAAPAKPKKPAPKRAAPKSSASSTGTPGWVWGFCGLFIGIVVVSGWYIFSRPGGTPGDTAQVDIALPAGQAEPDASDTAAKAKTGATSRNAQKTAPAEKPAEPRFSFYKMLPNYHVDVDDDNNSRASVQSSEEAPHEAAEPDNETHSQLATGNNAPTESSPPATSSSADNDGVRYVIQAGAFSTANDADRRKAQLALLGVTADIVDIRTASGHTVYRVQSTAVDSPGQAQSLAQRLKSHGIETMVRQAN